MDVRRHARIAERAHQDCIKLTPQHGKAVRRNGDAVSKVAGGTPVEFVELDSSARRLEDLDGLRDYLLADSVAGENCNSLDGSHARELTK